METHTHPDHTHTHTHTHTATHPPIQTPTGPGLRAHAHTHPPPPTHTHTQRERGGGKCCKTRAKENIGEYRKTDQEDRMKPPQESGGRERGSPPIRKPYSTSSAVWRPSALSNSSNDSARPEATSMTRPGEIGRSASLAVPGGKPSSPSKTKTCPVLRSRMVYRCSTHRRMCFVNHTIQTTNSQKTHEENTDTIRARLSPETCTATEHRAQHVSANGSVTEQNIARNLIPGVYSLPPSLPPISLCLALSLSLSLSLSVCVCVCVCVCVSECVRVCLPPPPISPLPALL
jgi:hypothetical protein